MSEIIPEWATDFDSWIQRAAARIEGQEQPKFWDEAKVDPVLAKIKPSYWREPFDRMALAKDLEATKALYDSWKDSLDLRPTNNQARKRADRIQKLSERLLLELPNPDNLRPKGDPLSGPPDVFGQLMFQRADEVDLLRSTITGLEEIKERAARLSVAAIRKDDRAPNTANDWLIGKAIPRIFERYFTAKPQGVNTTNGRRDPYGPAIDFVLAVLDTMQVTSSHQRRYGPYGIVEIWRRAKTWSDMGFPEKK
jgi:hypothetical protein